MFAHVHKFIKKTHNYFSKSNLRLLSLLGIAFALVVTVILVQQQQDLRQRAADSCTPGVDCPDTTTTICSVSGASYDFKCTSSGQSRDFTFMSTTKGQRSYQCQLNSVCVQSGATCIKCVSSSSQPPATNPGSDVVCDPNNVCVEKCGSTTCTTNQTCVRGNFNDVIAVCATQRSVDDGGNCDTASGKPNSLVCKSGKCGADLKCASSSSSGGNSGGNTTPGDSGAGMCSSGGTSHVCTGSEVCGNNQFESCGAPGYYCCGGKKCGSDKQCYDPPSNTGGGTGGNTITSCSGKFCNNTCYTGCGTGETNYTCTTTGAACVNNGCGSGLVYAGSNKCCPANQPNLCSDGFCKVSCTPPTVTPDPRPSTFTLTTPNMDCTSAYLSWGTSTGATSYAVETYIDPSQPPIASLSKSNLPLSPTTYKVTGLSQNTIYYFGIVANGTGTLKRTLVVNGVTKCAAPPSGGTTSTTKKAPTASTSNNSGSNNNASPVPPKTSNPTITTTIAPSITANTVTLSLSLTLPGIGNSSEFKNPNPKRAQRTISVAAVDSNNTTITAQSNLTFDSSSNSYKGTVSISSLPAGTYTIKVRFDNTLWKKLPGNIVITNGNNNPTSVTAQLISGDLDQNNSLDVLDYTNFVKCYKGLSSCTATLATLADLDDDGTAKDDLDDLTILQQGFNTQTQGD